MITGLNLNIAVVDEQQRVAGLGGQIGQHADFGVGHFGGGNDQADVARREFRDEAADVVGGGVVGAADAEQDFVLRIVLHGVRADGFIEVRVAAVHGLEDGDRANGGVGGQGLGRQAKPPAPRDGRDDGQQPVSG
jgi:hypothetical protein